MDSYRVEMPLTWQIPRLHSSVRTLLNCWSPDVCLDLGTARTPLLFRGERGVHVEPSVVALRDALPIAVGSRAREMEGRVPRGLDVIRPMEAGIVVHLGEATALVRRVLEKRRLPAARPPRFMVAVQMDATGLERQAVMAVARAAGARDVALVPAVLAAAIGAGLPVLEPRGSMVVDVGAGTVDAAVVSLGGIVVGRTLRGAGEAMDAALWRWLRWQHGLSVGQASAEQLKLLVGCALPRRPRRRARVRGLDMARGLPATLEVDSDQVCLALNGVLEAIVAHVRQVLDETPPELAADIHRHGIVLTGAAACLPRLDELISARTGLRARLAADPANCTVRGLEAFYNEPGLARNVHWSTARRTPGPLLVAPRPQGRRWAVSAAAGALALMFAFPAVTQAGQTWTTRVLSPFQAASSGLGSSGEDVYRLSAEVDQLRVENHRLQVAAVENERLRRLLHWSRAQAFELQAAPVIARSPSDWFAGVSIGAGTPQGVRRGAVVTSPGGLVGILSEVGPASSQVKLVTDASSVVPCVLQRGGSGVLYGTGGPTCEVRYLDPDAHVRLGDTVRTSGINASFPRGLIIGHVVAVGREGVYRTVTVRPSADIGSLASVVVLSPQK